VLIHRTDVCLEDGWLRGGGTDDFGEPPQMGRAPGRSAGITASMPQPKGVETNLRGLEILDGFILDSGDIDGVRSPERIRRAKGLASRRSVLMRSPACVGVRDGATTQQIWPFLAR
jgi:hypothetical protein